MDTRPIEGVTLVFDLDGTLVDTAPDLLRTLNHVLGQAGCPPRPLEEVRPFISFGARRMIVEGLAAEGAERGACEIDTLLAAFLDHYAANVAVDSRPYPGVVESLEWASAAGARLAVCTNKYERLSRSLLSAVGLARYFHAVAGRDTFPVWKPDAGHLTGAVEMAGGDAARAIMIGDSATDVKTARAAGVPSIVVTFGYSEYPPRELGADAVVDRFAELTSVIPRLIPVG